jgi:hypothetical protein
VIDVGSTGSRLHIFELVTTFLSESSSATNDSKYTEQPSNEPNTKARIECLRRGSSKAWTPLSAFAADSSKDRAQPLNATHVAHHMLPLFDYASDIIPPSFHASTPVRIAATAGMRLLPLDEQIRVYDALYEGLSEQIPNGRFTFSSLTRGDVFTLHGEREGFFGAVAANYLRGVIDAELRVIVHPDEEPQQLLQEDEKMENDDGLCTNKFGMCEPDAESIVFGPSHHYVPQQRHDVRAHGPLGALDMGGSSTQIVYRRTGLEKRIADAVNEAVKNEGNLLDVDVNDEYDVPSHLHDDEFFSTSYLSYGADQFRERLWDLWVSEAEKLNTDPDISIIGLPVISNPCSFVGHELSYKGYTLIGMGDAVQCAEQINRLIPHHDNAIDLDELYDENLIAAKIRTQQTTTQDVNSSKRKMVGGVEHPPLPSGGKFYGMSLYFFTLDCLRELSDPDHPIRVSWPAPSIEELTHALDGFCARKWQGDLEEVQHEAHEHTRAEVLPHRCVEAVYMVTLLRDGFGFHPSSRDITFTQWVDGNEVEWSLGLALSEFATERRIAKENGDKLKTEEATP